MCGKETGLVIADIEGVELKVCSGCSKHGQIKKKLITAHLSDPHRPLTIDHSSSIHSLRQGSVQGSSPRTKREFKVVDSYSTLLRSAREERGMKQEDFSKMLNERESIVAKWESGGLKPRLEVAKRVGRVLGINLIEEDLEVTAKIDPGKKTDEPTLGDFVKVRKRK